MVPLAANVAREKAALAWVAAGLAAMVAMVAMLPSCSRSQGPAKPAAAGGADGKGELSGDLIIFHAGSLAVPLRKVSEEFMARHPKVKVLAEAGGSRDVARKVSDLHHPCDVLGSADYKVVEDLLMPRFAKFNLRFATNEMAIVHTAKAARAAEITAENWPEILLAEKVRFGRADPNRDPCGYRTEMLFQLAEKHYKTPGLAKRLTGKDGQRFIRPKETDLLALLESGEIDYLFIYRSVGIQHGLRVLRLPDEVNLSNPMMDTLYATATVKVTGKQPGEFVTQTGEAIVYSVTIPLSAPNRPAAEAYVGLLLSSEGRKILADCGQGLVDPALADGWDAVPESLRARCRKP